MHVKIGPFNGVYPRIRQRVYQNSASARFCLTDTLGSALIYSRYARKRYAVRLLIALQL
jgi:hypothetical protein